MGLPCIKRCCIDPEQGKKGKKFQWVTQAYHLTE
jgi:hypothetical protein